MPGISEFNTIDPTFLTGRQIVASLTNEQVKQIVFDLGADRCEEKDKCYIFPTICHNTDSSEASMKLYYYFDRKLFICYTECDEAFNVIGLVLHVKQLTNKEYNYIDAKNYVSKYITNIAIESVSHYESINDRYRKHITASQLPNYNENVLKAFVNTPHISWIKDGIDCNVMKQFEIKYCLDGERIVIPYRDIEGRLIGIRVRNINYEFEELPKYCPLMFDGITYSHPLSLSLYGAYQNKEAIKCTKTAIIFESEKSVLLHKGYYKNDSNAVAICGSNLSKPQVDILTRQLGATHIILALDKEYVSLNDAKSGKYFDKLYDMASKYTNYANFDIVYDFDGVLNEKNSPIDLGQNIWEQLYNSKVKVKG